jgi:parallel beta-helix repeat protein
MSRTKKALARLAGLALGVAPLIAVTPNAAADAAVRVSCGEIITVDTKLANDLTNCPRHGIIVGADGITLDLNGHTVDGDATPFEDCPEDEPCDVGIVNSALRNGTPFNGPGFDRVTIENGSVQDFSEVGVYIVGARHNSVRRMDTSRSEFESDGVHLIDCTHCRIEDSSGSDYSVGFVVVRSRDVVIQRSDASDNTFAGIIVAESEQVDVSDNTVTRTAEGDGIVFILSQHGVVKRNHVFGNAGGIGLVASDDNDVTHNATRDNRFVGIYAYGSDRNEITRNAITGNGDGSEGGIHLLATEEGDGADNNVLTGNRLVRNFGDGILVDPGQSGTSIGRNIARLNSDDGIDVGSSSATLFANTLIRNRDLGIRAAAGVTDGGGNVAVHNGNRLQCVNVRCR